MTLASTLSALAAVLLLGLAAARANARRGIGRWSLVPWDWILVAAVFAALLLAARAASLLAGRG